MYIDAFMCVCAGGGGGGGGRADESNALEHHPSTTELHPGFHPEETWNRGLQSRKSSDRVFGVVGLPGRSRSIWWERQSSRA